jgi:hypothetical protein
MQNLRDAINRLKAARIKGKPVETGRPLTAEEKESVGKQIKEALK